MNESKTLPLGRILIATALFFTSIHFCFSVKAQTIASVIMGLPLLAVLILPVKQAPSFVFYYACMCFCIAERTIYLTSFFRIYPQEIIIWFLFFYLLFTRWATQEKSMVPVTGKIFAALVALGIITAMNHEIEFFDRVLFYAKGALSFLPIFFCVRRVVSSERVLQTACIFLVAAAAVASLMHIADFHGWNIAKILFGETEKEAYVAYREEMLGFANPFYRSFGIHTLPIFMTCSIYLIFFITLYLYQASKNQKLKIFLRVAQLAAVVLIFESGYRSIWIAFMISAALYGMHQGKKGILGLILLAVAVVVLLPQSARGRLGGLYGETQDTSVQERTHLVENAIQIVRDEPLLGRGWSSAGLAHSDILQFAADAGVGTAAAFLLFYGGILFQLYRRFRQAKRQKHHLESHCMIVFFSALAGYLFIFSVNSHLNVQETFIAFWLMLAFGAKLATLPVGESASTRSSSEPLIGTRLQ